MKNSNPPPRINSAAPSPIPILIAVDPVAGMVGVGLVVTVVVPPVPPLAALTVMVCEQLALEELELVLSEPALSVKIEVAVYVPGLL